MQDESRRALRETMTALAQSYVPEWRFSPDDPDAGSVMALLLEDMLADSEARFSEVLRMHRIHYLNLFDRLCPQPVRPAQTYVRFEPVASASGPVYVPRGTELQADGEAGGAALTFETEQGITVTGAVLDAIVEAQRGGDRIVTVLDGASADRCTFTVFDPDPESEAHHILTLEFDRGLEALGGGEVGLRMHTSDPDDAPAAAETLAQAHFFLPGEGEEEGLRPLAAPRAEGDTLWLALEPDVCETSQRFVLCIQADGPQDIALSGAELVFAREDVAPDEVWCGGVTQPAGRFAPFGNPLELYAECGVESRAVFARPGADVRMEFDIDFETLEQTLPEPELDIDYKVIMKKTRPVPKPETRDVKPDYVLIEYLSTRGWKRLVPDENAALLFNGSAQGHVTLAFRCPDDMLPAAEMTGDYRLRMRMLRAEGLYQLPCRQHIPVVTNLRFSYSYAAHPLAPTSAVALNNFASRDLTPLWRKQRAAQPFVTAEQEGACLYLGFDAPPEGSPLSLYFEVENNEDLPLDYAVEYLSPSGFEPAQTADGTEGLRYSGAMLILVPADVSRGVRYGKDRYWLRLRCAQMAARPGLPVVHGIRVNTVRAVNRATRTEEFYIDDPRAAVTLHLQEQNLLGARVYVNETSPAHPDGEWVEWQKRVYAAQRGRFYELDTEAGTVTFDKHTFSVYAPPEGAPAVRVEYRSYQGAQGNVPAGAIRTMTRPVRFISRVENTMAAYGGVSETGEEAAARRVSDLLRTRGRAVSERDYFDIISQLGCGVRQIKCRSGVTPDGESAPDTVTVALLIDEYEKGSHIFSAVKDAVADALTKAGGLVPLGKTLVLCQPQFVRFSVSIWLRCNSMEEVYEAQRATERAVRAFLDPLSGGFDGRGWKIGVLPTSRQLLAYLKLRDASLHVERMAVVARVDGQDHAVDEDFLARVKNPFVMAVNGVHTVYARTV